MSLTDRINQGAAIARWKVDQQARILKLKAEISSSEASARMQKAKLAEAALAQYKKGPYSVKAIDDLCKEIEKTLTGITSLENEVEATKNEQPPMMEFSTATAAPQDLSGLKCPECGRELIGKFCPEHGVEGVLVDSSKDSAPKPKSKKAKGSLVCPVCGETLNGKFCPIHGVEGKKAN